MKTLYVSDLDGTLLRSDETVSDFTAQTINALVERGVLFSYATARSYVTASKVARGIHARIPVIVYNGAFAVDNVSEQILLSNYFGNESHDLLDDFLDRGIFPIVYAMVDGVERFSYLPEKATRGQRYFLNTRKGDPRDNPVQEASQLHRGDLFYITAIGEEKVLEPLYRKYKEEYHCVFDRDIYSGEQWLEIMPKQASKASAIAMLKEKLNCDRLVVFGDGKNDLDMFRLADEAYAMENAAQELKAAATAVIGSNNADGVAKWLLEHVK